MRLQVVLFMILNSLVLSEKAYPKFNVYWNVPTQLCKHFGIIFDLEKAFGFIQNTGDKFFGDKVSIFYRPGKFPYYNGSAQIWGGIPQRGIIQDHIKQFQKQIQNQLPNNFKGIAVLDFEDYEPFYDTAPKIYKEKSIEYIKRVYPKLKNKDEIEAQAKLTFDEHSRQLFQDLLTTGLAARPGAKFGYYHYPYCKNPSQREVGCDPKQVREANETAWLYERSGAVFPSIYLFKNKFSNTDRALRVLETLKLAKKINMKNKQLDKPILPYFWFKYHDEVETFVSEDDFLYTMFVVAKLHINGIVIWGSNHDVSSKGKCMALQNYVNSVIGPLVLISEAVQSSKEEFNVDAFKEHLTANSEEFLYRVKRV